MKNKKYLKSMNECINNENEDNSIIDKVFNNEMIYEQLYKLELDVIEYTTQKNYFENKAQVTEQEMNRLRKMLD